MFRVLDNIAEGILVIDKQSKIIYTNSKLESVFGYNSYELLGKPLDTLIPKKYAGDHSGHIADYFAKPSSRNMGGGKELYGLNKGGDVFPIEVSLSFFKDDGKDYSLAIVVDVSHQKEVLNRLNLSKAIYTSLVENTTDHIFQIDREKKILYINQVSPGLKKENVIGESLLNLLPDDATKKRVEAVIDKVIETGNPESYEIDFPTPVGILHYDTTVSPVIKEGQIIGANLISRDSTEEVNLRNKLIEQQEFIRKINEYSINGIYIYHLGQSKNTYINKAYSDILGYTIEDINGMSQEAFFDCFHDDDKEAVGKHMEEVVKLSRGEASELLYRFRSKSGQWTWCKSIDSGFEFDDDGNVVSFIGSFIDVTELKRTELLLKEKNRDIENFAHIASHDLKAPLNTIIHGLQLIQKEILQEVDKSFLQQELINSANRMNQMINSLLTNSKIDGDHIVEEFDVNITVNDILKDLSQLIKDSNAVISYNDLPTINGIRPLFGALIQNLITNSIKFKGESRDPEIEISCTERPDHYGFIYQDNGRGIEQDYLERVFNMFERGSQHGNVAGSGIGLANSKKIVSKHGGKIWVESEVGVGSKFYFTIQKKD